tara:strand:+ start:13646 stop:14302 length:657 start_codon:yes stop_codon:yes gene_type:complete
MDTDTFLEEVLGKFVDIALYDLYWNNSLFSTNEFTNIITTLSTKDKCLKVTQERKKLFNVIIRNIVYKAQCNSCKNGNYRVPYIFEMYVLYALYVKNPMYIFNSVGDVVFNPQAPLTFLHKVISNNNFPSKYDCHCELYDFVIECEHMSKFVAEKKTNDKSSILPTSTNGIETVPSSIDKIIDTITKLIESESTTLSADDQAVLDEIDNEVNNLMSKT